MQEVITNAATGEITIRDLTLEEIAAMQPNITDLRAAMSCSRMQGILALGESRWATILAYRATATWAEQIVIDAAGDWHRTSQNIQFFGYLLNLSDAEIDALFQTAAQIVA